MFGNSEERKKAVSLDTQTTTIHSEVRLLEEKSGEERRGDARRGVEKEVHRARAGEQQRVSQVTWWFHGPSRRWDDNTKL